MTSLLCIFVRPRVVPPRHTHTYRYTEYAQWACVRRARGPRERGAAGGRSRWLGPPSLLSVLSLRYSVGELRPSGALLTVRL
eukprot:COSAG02_NODE_15373_length_1176_cov_2.160631_3_plen_81_part_01